MIGSHHRSRVRPIERTSTGQSRSAMSLILSSIRRPAREASSIRSIGLVHFIGPFGDANDNGVIEWFWVRMHTELLDRQDCRTRVEFSTEIFDYIEFFRNRARRNRALDSMQPDQFEGQIRQSANAACPSRMGSRSVV
jgi:transposase InsO family protein